MKSRLCFILLGAAAAVSAFVLPASAAGPGTTVTYQGEAAVITATPACAGIAGVGDYYKLIYRYKFASTDPADSLAFLGKDFAFQLSSTLPSGSLAGPASTTNTYLDRYATLSTGLVGSTDFNIASSGGLPSGTAINLKIIGAISDFKHATGCQVSVRGLLVIHPAGT